MTRARRRSWIAGSSGKGEPGFRFFVVFSLSAFSPSSSSSPSSSPAVTAEEEEDDERRTDFKCSGVCSGGRSASAQR